MSSIHTQAMFAGAALSIIVGHGLGGRVGRPIFLDPIRSSAITSPCLAADDYAAFQINHIKQIIAATDSVGVAFRAETHLPVVADSALVVVSDSATCANALTTYNANVDHTGSGPTALYVIRAGSVFVASIEPGPDVEFAPQIVMDSSFNYLGMYLR